MTTIDLTNTNANAVSAALVAARRAAGNQAVGMVLTLIVVVDESTHYDAMRSALDAGREHPSRTLVVITRPGRGEARLDAEIRVADSRPGDTIVLRLYGELAKHADSVVLPLLLPDTPVVVWWPSKAPPVPGEDQLGVLAQRRITDAAAVAQPIRALHQRAQSYYPGDTDLSWTRLTPWRALLAAALDQLPGSTVSAATVEAERGNPSAEVLASWLGGRLGVDVTRRESSGPGITLVQMSMTDSGDDVVLSRPDGVLAWLDLPGAPVRPVALRRRDIAELLAEELRRLDPDEVYATVIKACAPVNGAP
jgi:glucose-6-phosphate dehydrogenase assembly protein OpcA